MAAVISNEGGFYSASAYISECRRMGLEILQPDINLSQVDYCAEGSKAIRIGLRFVANLSGNSVANIFTAREKGRFHFFAGFRGSSRCRLRGDY